jgi:hypothetical protein
MCATQKGSLGLVGSESSCAVRESLFLLIYIFSCRLNSTPVIRRSTGMPEYLSLPVIPSSLPPPRQMARLLLPNTLDFTVEGFTDGF